MLGRINAYLEDRGLTELHLPRTQPLAKKGANMIDPRRYG